MTRALRILVLLAAIAASLPAATTLEPTSEGLAIRAKAYREHLVYIILKDGTSRAAKAPLKITSRSITFTDPDNKQPYLYQIADVNMPATLHVNNDLIPQGLWMDEQNFAMKDLQVRRLSPEELTAMHIDIAADLAAAKEAYRDAYVGAACSGKIDVAAELCAMNATASADRKIKVIEAKAKSDVQY